MAVEGLPRNASTHAAGVVISDRDVADYVPLQKNDDVITTQFPMGIIEELGLLKMDFLGLRTLTVIRDTVSLAEKRGEKVDIDNLDYDIKEVYDLISTGDTAGIFQLESAGMQSFMKELRPSSLEDIIAGVSLYRPGPMDSIPRYVQNKRNPSRVSYKHPLLKKILDVTYGCIVYQEQVMQIVQTMAGYTLAHADMMRRAMSKKKADVMQKEREVFCDGSEKNGISRKIADDIYSEMESFASYAFNKSHAAAYAVLSYQTAYLKCFYKTYFMAAMFNSFITDADKISFYARECERMGIEILPPHINKSFYEFTEESGAIRYGLGAIRNVGKNVADEIAAERANGGDFLSLGDFIRRMSGKDINKRALEGIIKCGAFDFTGKFRSQMLASFEDMMNDQQRIRKHNIDGQIDMFGGENEISDDDVYLNIKEFSHKELLAMEKEVIGVYISGHPLDDYKETLSKYNFTPLLDVKNADSDESSLKDGDTVTVSGIVSSRKNKITKSNSMMSFVNLEDLSSAVEVIVFPKVLTSCDEILNSNEPIIVRGRISSREDEETKLLAETISPLLAEDSVGTVTVTVSKDKLCNLDTLRETVLKHRGNLLLKIKTEKDVFITPFKVNEAFIKEAEKIMGENTVV